MSDQGFDPADITVMRKEGDLGAFLRQRIRPTLATNVAVTPAVKAEASHRPGAWPAGTTTSSARCSCPRCLKYAERTP